MKRFNFLSYFISYKIIIFLIAFCIAFFKICSLDTFWHLKAGEYFLLNGKILSQNTFSWTFPQYHWIPTYWLFEVILKLIYDLSGFAGIIIFRATIISLTYGCLFYFFTRNKRNIFVVFILFLTLLDLSFFRFLDRPHIFTFLGLSLTVICTEKLKEKFSPVIIFFILPLIFLTWVNLHSGVVFGLIYYAFFLSDFFFTKILFIREKNNISIFYKLLLSFIISSIVTLINPNGFGYLIYLFDHTNMNAIIPLEEFIPLNFAHHTKQCMQLSFLIILSVILSVRQKRINPANILMISFSIYLLFKGIRFIPDVCFFLLPAILSALNTYDFKLSEKFNLLIIPIAFIYCLNIHLFVFAKPESIFKSGIGIHDASYPVEALKYISPDNSLKLYNDISSAGYLVWASDGKIKVFQDGRIHAYPPSFFKSIQEAVYSGTKWKELMETYKINTILLTKNECTVIQLNYLYTKEWRIVFEDNNYILAEKKL